MFGKLRVFFFFFFLKGKPIVLCVNQGEAFSFPVRPGKL